MSMLKTKQRLLYTKQTNDLWENLVSKLNCETDTSYFWKQIKIMCGTQRPATNYIKDNQGNRIYNTREQTEIFRRHLQEVHEEDSDDDEYDRDNLERVENYINENNSDFQSYQSPDLERLNNECPPISTEEIKKIIKYSKQNAPGPSGITKAYLENLPTNMINYLKVIYNNSLALGYYPKIFKEAKIILIPKDKRSTHNYEKYREISLLETHGKVFGKILNRRLTDYLEENELMNPRKHGFRRTRGTGTAHVVFWETVANNINNKYRTDIVLRDVAIAFDKVWHNGLKFKISQIPLHQCLKRILYSYLDERIARINLREVTSNSIMIRAGVPHGASLSATLYAFYTADMPEPLYNTDYIAYADDITQIIRNPNKSVSLIARTTCSAIEQINAYEKRWKIKTNMNIFKLLQISRRKSENFETTTGDYIRYENTGKMLGLKINNTGFIPQMNHRIKLAEVALNKIIRFKKLSMNNKLMLYKATVRPVLIYPIIPLNVISFSQNYNLQKVQNKFLRFATNTTWDQCRTAESLHARVNLEAINIVIHRQAKNTWEKIQENHPEIYEKICEETPERRTNQRFPSSRQKAEGPEPRPIYTRR